MEPSCGARGAFLRSGRVAAVALVVTVGGLGCERKKDADRYFGTTARRGKAETTFYLNNHDEPEYIDPGLSTESAGSTLLMDLFEGLVVQHPEDLRPVQGVAVRYDKSEDNRHFRFHLRPDAKWSDGKPVAADDFVYAWRRVLTPATGARMATLMYPLKNGKGFHQGKLKATAKEIVLRHRPEASSGGPKLAPETAVKILRTTPARTSAAPFSGKVDGRPVTFEGALKREGAILSEAGDAPLGVAVLGTGPTMKCNGVPDRWYQVRGVEGSKGWLPGCALERDPEARWALVEVFEGRPTFRPSATPTSAEGDRGGEGGADHAVSAPEPAAGGGREPSANSGGAGSATDEAAPDSTRPAKEGRGEPPARGFVALEDLVADPSVIGVRAVNDRTLEVELEEPTPYFLELASYVTYYPVRQDVIERYAAQGRPDLWYRPENIVTNGPYVLADHKFRYEITFERNPHYHHHDALKVHRVVWLEVPDYHATMNLYETGEIDYIGSNVSLPTAHLDRLSAYEDFERSVWLATYWYEFNVDVEPVNDVRVRRALNLAVDKQLLVDKVTRGGQEPATHIIPDATGSGYAELAQKAGDPMGKGLFAGEGWDFDPERARALLGEAGYPVREEGDGFRAEGFPPLEILYNTSEGHRAIAVAIQDMFKRHLGISVQLRNEEWKVMLKNLRDGHFQIARFGWVADYNHPHTYLDTFLSYSNNNWTNWGDPRFDHLVERAASTADPLASMRLYRQAERRAMEAMPRMPLYFYTKSTLIKPYVKGYYPNAANRHQVKWMWIDPDWRNDRDNRPAYPPEELPPPGSIEASTSQAP